ncbi:hypothetical protein F511_47223 [Dorcoceras hygrometricum]|uniref:Uncharacterized protein n=1 Tax=Dorcoceras hygrometricum TaxID=472368 RepID=A0A2Z6ZY66_9LAMI|nr:hypothetical protein F511_47223 [Dorcoceras hygrometricum]
MHVDGGWKMGGITRAARASRACWSSEKRRLAAWLLHAGRTLSSDVAPLRRAGARGRASRLAPRRTLPPRFFVVVVPPAGRRSGEVSGNVVTADFF